MNTYEFVAVGHHYINRSLDEFKEKMAELGFPDTGQVVERRKILRLELKGHPKFLGLNGPLWNGIKNGENVIRYETSAAFKALSI